MNNIQTKSSNRIKIEISDLAKSFNYKNYLFQNLNYTISHDSFLAITGSNGTGKSTFIKMLAAISNSTKGKIEYFLDDKKIESKEFNSFYTFVAPYLNIYEEFSPIEMFDIYCKLKNIDKNVEKFEKLLSQYKLYHRKEDSIKTFSSGMKQRVKFCLAFYPKSSIIFLDEPMTNLDVEGIKISEDLINNAYESGSAILIASNDQNEINLCKNKLDLTEFA